MAYCKAPGPHRTAGAWWTEGFSRFDYRRKKIVPHHVAMVHCSLCPGGGWGTTNRELVAKLPTQHPDCPDYGQRHEWQYHSDTKRQCLQCWKTETRTL
jgi:hypothetical protein